MNGIITALCKCREPCCVHKCKQVISDKFQFGRDTSNSILFAECVFSYLVTVLVPPSIAPGPTNITVTVNVQTTLACEATGIPKPSINWRKNGHLLNVDQNQNSYR